MKSSNPLLTEKINRIATLLPLWGDDFTRLKPAEVKTLEKAAGFQFSDLYLAFLTQYGASIFDELVFYEPLNRLPKSYTSDGRGLFGVFLGKKSSLYAKSNTIKWRQRIMEGMLPRSFVPIIHDSNVNVICLGLDEKGKERVYFWHAEDDFDIDEYEDKPVPKKVLWRALTMVATSFEDFLDRLAPEKVHKKNRRKK